MTERQVVILLKRNVTNNDCTSILTLRRNYRLFLHEIKRINKYIKYLGV